MGSPLTVVLLAAGKGTRMKREQPKVLHPLCGRPLVGWAVAEAAALRPERIVLVVAGDGERVTSAARAAAGDVELVPVVQEPQRGTGDALRVAGAALGSGPGRVLVGYGDMPLLRAASLRSLLAAQAAAGAGATGVLTALVDDPTGYGRVLREASGAFRGIVEQADASEEERRVREVNLGVYAFERALLGSALERLRDDNAQGEYYLPDALGILRADGHPVVGLALEDLEEARGINTVAELAVARHAMQMRILGEHMAGGVLIVDPATTYIDHGVEIGAGTEILPCTVVRSNVRIGRDCEVGPFTHLRPGTVLADGAEIGNFTECKNSTIGPRSKAKHLSYLGDTHIGADANIGAGTIFANYDGRAKHRSEVGDRAFVGSGTIVVAPNRVPADSVTGAGAVITRSAHMQPGQTWVGMPARELPRRPRGEGER